LIDKSQAIEHYRFDGFTHGGIPYFWVLMGSLIEDVADAEFVKHGRNKPQMI